MKRTGIKNAILTLLVSLTFVSQAFAVTLAVFPVDDLSQEHNSMNQEITSYVVDQVKRRGLELVSSERIFDYLKERRIRKLGYLDTLEIMSARDYLKADLILFTSICQQNSKSGTIGLTVSLVRTSDGKTIWANTAGVSLVDEQRFLGVNAPSTIEELQPILASKLFADWPSDLDFTAGRQVAGDQMAAVKETAYIQVETIFFSPKYVQPGEEVNCTIRFKNNDAAANRAKVFIKVGNRVHLASSDDGIYYKAAWVGSDGKPGNELQVASVNLDSMILKGVWAGDAKDANYPVSLILDWPSGKREESYLGSYVVDSVAPQATLKLKGKTFGDHIAFRDTLPISVRFEKNEPIKKWEFKVFDMDGEVILQERGSNVAPESFIWRGQTSRNIRADSGLYTVSLTVWDRAGNSSEARESVFLLDTVPGAELVVTESDSALIVNLTAKDSVPVTHWHMELWSDDNVLLSSLDGQGLPAKVRLPDLADNIDKDKIACILSLRDSLGSKSKKKHLNILSSIESAGMDDESLHDASTEATGWDADF